MSLVAALTAGGVVGVRHALEADHLAAIATLVDEDRSGLVGTSWGIGHTFPILVLGLLFVALGVRVPDSVSEGFEVIVGVVLLVYGARLLAEVGGLLSVETHTHDGGAHTHLRMGWFSLGLTHVHLDGDSALVGLLHGLAGSGALVVVMATTAPSPGAAVGFLLSFGLATTVTMTAIAAVWGRTLGTTLARALKTVGGLVGVTVGAALIAEVGFGVAVLP